MMHTKLSRTLFILLLVAFHVPSHAISKKLIPLKNITVLPANISQWGSGIEKIADGKCSTDYEIFHTRWSGMSHQNISINADLEGKGKQLDKVILYPRSIGQNGIIKEGTLWVMAKGKYQKIADINGELNNTPIEIELNKPILNPEKIRLIITDSYGDLQSNLYVVSLGELECVMLPKDAITKAILSKDAEVFSDLTGVALKPTVTMAMIQKMKAPALKAFATRLYNHNYKPDSLIGNFSPYLNPMVVGSQLRIGDGFSKYEGITGIVLGKGENIIFVGKTMGSKIKLMVPDWTRKAPFGVKPEEDPAGWGLHNEMINLSEGVNQVYLKKGGLVYIQYLTDTNPEKFPAVTVHFPTGKYNGYFDLTRGDSNEDFDKLLAHAISPIMDMKGKHIQVAFPVDSLKKYTLGKGVDLIQNYDTILSLQQQFSGLNKEGIVPKNHILARVNYHYYMFRDGDGVAFVDWAMKLVAKPKSVITLDPCWGFSHEVGHVFQMRPQLTWGGMTEVSNNILTMYSYTSVGNKSLLSEKNIYAKAREKILDKGISYMDFPGKAGKNTNQYGGDDNTDVFQRLVPFWQLYLYFKAQGYTDFYPDLMIAMRKQAPLGGHDRNKNYLNMLEFCKLACVVSKTDLTDFFSRWGFFYVGEIDVMDYSSYLYQVSQQEINEVKNAIAAMKLPKPKIDITTVED